MDPMELRRAMVEYVQAVHRAYLDAATTRLGRDAEGQEVLGSLPLTRAPFTVAAVGAQRLHVIATRDLDAPGDERVVEVDGSLGPMRWTVRFLDPVVVPELGFVADDAEHGTAPVRAALGIGETLYHLVAELDGSLSPHQAMHAGTGLAHAHLRAVAPVAGDEEGGA